MGYDHIIYGLEQFMLYAITHAAATPITRAGYGRGTGPVLLDNVACTGRESRLIDCRANPIGSHNCDHGEDSGVICAPLFIPGPGTYVHVSII